MTTEELLNLDYYKGVNSVIFQKALRQIKSFQSLEEEKIVSLELLEKLIYTYECKYAIMINYICPVFIPDERRMFSATIRNTDTKELYPTIYGSSIYELFTKICIFYYWLCSKKKSVGLKDWSKKYDS